MNAIEERIKISQERIEQNKRLLNLGFKEAEENLKYSEERLIYWKNLLVKYKLQNF